jgi:hypothetical protein
MKRRAVLLLAGVLVSCGVSSSLALTLSEARSAIRRNVRDTASSTSLRRYSDAVLLAYVNEAQRVIINATWASSDSSTQAAVSGTGTYAYPSEAIHVWRVTYAGANLPELDFRWKDVDTQNNAWETTTGTPEAFVRDRSEPGTIRLSPVPSASGSEVKLFYFQRVPDLASDTDVPFDSDDRLYPYHDLIVYHVSARIFMSENRTAEAAIYGGLFDEGVEEMNVNVGNKPLRPVAPATAAKP